MVGALFTALRVLVTVTASLSLLLCVTLTTRASIKFATDPEVRDMLMSSIKWTSLAAMICFSLNVALSVFGCFYLTLTDHDIPLWLIIAMGILYGAGKTAKYLLFIVRIKSSFESSVYQLNHRSVVVLYTWLAFTVVTAGVGFLLWDPDLSQSSPRRWMSVLFLCCAGLSHTSMSMFFIHLFVSKLRNLLQKSTFLRVLSDGRHINADELVKKQVTEASIHDSSRREGTAVPPADPTQGTELGPMELLDDGLNDSTDEDNLTDSEWGENDRMTSPPAPGLDEKMTSAVMMNSVSPPPQALTDDAQMQVKQTQHRGSSRSSASNGSAGGSSHDSTARLKGDNGDEDGDQTGQQEKGGYTSEFRDRTQSVPLVFDSGGEKETMDEDGKSPIERFKSRSEAAKRANVKNNTSKHHRINTAPNSSSMVTGIGKKKKGRGRPGLSPIPSESSKRVVRRRQQSVESKGSWWRRESSNVMCEKQIVNSVIDQSEFADNTLVVLMARYTLLKIVSVILSLLSLISVAMVVILDVDATSKKDDNSRGNKSIHESEIVIFFLNLDVSMNMLCLFLTFFSFGFGPFKYNVLCGKFEVWLMHGFEQWLKQDFYERLLIEAKKHLDELLETEDIREVEKKNQVKKQENERVSRQITFGFGMGLHPSSDSLAPAVAAAATVSAAATMEEDPKHINYDLQMNSIELAMENEGVNLEVITRGFSSRQSTGRSATLRQMQKPKLIGLASALV